MVPASRCFAATRLLLHGLDLLLVWFLATVTPRLAPILVPFIEAPWEIFDVEHIHIVGSDQLVKQFTRLQSRRRYHGYTQDKIHVDKRVHSIGLTQNACSSSCRLENIALWTRFSQHVLFCLSTHVH